MKNGSYNLGDFYRDVPIGAESGAEGEPRMLGTAEAFVKPILQLIQRFYTFNSQFDIDDENASIMMISDKFKYDHTEWGRKPTVVVMRGPITRTPDSLMAAREQVIPTTGAMIYKRKYMSAVQIMCISSEYAEQIATQIFDLLDMMPREVAAAGVFKMEGLVLNPVTRVDNGAVPGLKMCIVSCKITTEKRWSETPTDSTMLRKANIHGLC